MDQSFEQQAPAAAPVPAPAPEKKSGGLAKILCVVFALIAVGLGVYLVIDKMNSSNTVSSDSANKTTGESKQCVTIAGEGENGEIAGNKKGYVFIADYHGTFYITKEGDVYYEPSYGFNSGDGNYIKYTVKDAGNIGTKGKYTLKFDDFEGYGMVGEDEDIDTFEIDGYKLDVSNIAFVAEGQYGHQKTHGTAILVDREGNMSTFVTTNLFKGEVSYKLNKNVDKNVRAVSEAEGYGAYATMIHYFDGSVKEPDYKKIGFDNE